MRGLAQWLDDPLLVLLELRVEGSLSFVNILLAQAPHYANSSVGSLRVPLSHPGPRDRLGWIRAAAPELQ